MAKPLQLLALTALAMTGAVARAQNQVCTGDGVVSPSVEWSVAVKINPTSRGRSDSDFLTLGPEAFGKLLDIAECACDSDDLYLRGLVTTPITAGVPPQFSVWMGGACDQVTSRLTTCEELADAPSINGFMRGATSGQAVVHVAVRGLLAPRTLFGGGPGHECIAGLITNSFWFLFGDPTLRPSCAVELDYYGTPPIAPAGVTADTSESHGHDAMVRWMAPGDANEFPNGYQVLCADQRDLPPGPGAAALGDDPDSAPYKLGYSTCRAPAQFDQSGNKVSPGIIQRQFLPSTGILIAPGSANGGAPKAALVTGQGDPVDAGEGSTDGGCPLAQQTPGVLATLDKRFVCSPVLPATATSAHITGLSPERCYRFVVVAIDAFGNPAPSPVAFASTPIAVPEPVLTGGGCSCALSERGRPPMFTGKWLAMIFAIAMALACARRRAQQ